MCSTKTASVKADVEGAKLNVCDGCARYGKIIGRVAPPQTRRDIKENKTIPSSQNQKVTETIQVIKSDYYILIRKAREKLNLNQVDFAKSLNEKESMLHKIESGHMKPDLELARKLEKALKISLVEQIEVESGGAQPSAKKGEGMTLGDLITIKKK
jgi:putative transcription factor